MVMSFFMGDNQGGSSIRTSWSGDQRWWGYGWMNEQRWSWTAPKEKERKKRSPICCCFKFCCLRYVPSARSSRLRGSGEGSYHLGLLYAAFPCISARGCFQDLNPWPHGHKAAALPLSQGSPSCLRYVFNKLFFSFCCICLNPMYSHLNFVDL